MKYLNMILAAVLVSIVAVQAAQDTALTQREVRDPRKLEVWLEGNASDAETRIAAVEAVDAETRIAAVEAVGATTTTVALAASAVQPTDADYTNAVALADSAVQAEADPVVSAIVGIVLSDGTNLSAAAAGTDYQAPLTAGADYLAPDGNLTGSMGTSTTAVNTVVSGAAAGATAAQQAVAGAPDVAGSADTLTNTVTITANDLDGDTLAQRRLVRVWVAETAYGAPSTNNIESLTLSGGTAIQTVTAAADYIYLTAATGIASAEVVGTAAGTNYVMVADGGYVTSEAVVFTAE